MYIRMYVDTYTVCTCVLWLYTYMYVRMYIDTYTVCACVLWLYTCMYVHVCTYMYSYVHNMYVGVYLLFSRLCRAENMGTFVH